MVATSSTTSTVTCHNGPICGTCGARYIGSHTCSHADIVRRINELMALLGTMPRTLPQERLATYPEDRTASCPCRPENGGGGVCGCILGAPRVIC